MTRLTFKKTVDGVYETKEMIARDKLIQGCVQILNDGTFEYGVFDVGCNIPFIKGNCSKFIKAKNEVKNTFKALGVNFFDEVRQKKLS